MIALITDSHFGEKHHSKPVFEMQMQFFEKQFFPYILEHKIDTVFHLGDLFHNRNVVDLYILQELKRRFFQWFDDNDVKLHMIVGNHDQYFKENFEYDSLTDNFKEFISTVTYNKAQDQIIDKYDFGFCPWGSAVPDGVDIPIGHFDIQSFIKNDHSESEHGYTIKDFSKFKLVLSGHYHKRMTKKNITYIGTQYQLDWSDFNEPKGFALLDKNYKLTFIENTVSPRFIKVLYSERETGIQISVTGLGDTVDATPEEAIEIIKNNYAKIIVERIQNQKTFDNFYNSAQMQSKDNFKIEVIDTSEVIESIDMAEIEAQIQEGADTITMIETFLSSMTFESEIDKTFLTECMRSVYKEANDMNTLIQTTKEL